eukprot:NODE_1887_length_1367_cov_29.553111_g1708_i0.p1 GENE.NODE_1887_length_1367_cov_29.553111_g1708_i0~~NODE_1887_length_1367_cov_29.553111_g1708_i0.p1  ORF type:complete len:408 (+),score=61.28 NODE_1887_length_1367_cov_29.553111_g1708_i0:94-1224(+)
MEMSERPHTSSTAGGGGGAESESRLAFIALGGDPVTQTLSWNSLQRAADRFGVTSELDINNQRDGRCLTFEEFERLVRPETREMSRVRAVHPDSFGPPLNSSVSGLANTSIRHSIVAKQRRERLRISLLEEKRRKEEAEWLDSVYATRGRGKFKHIHADQTAEDPEMIYRACVMRGPLSMRNMLPTHRFQKATPGVPSSPEATPGSQLRSVVKSSLPKIPNASTANSSRHVEMRGSGVGSDFLAHKRLKELCTAPAVESDSRLPKLLPSPTLTMPTPALARGSRRSDGKKLSKKASSDSPPQLASLSATPSTTAPRLRLKGGRLDERGGHKHRSRAQPVDEPSYALHEFVDQKGVNALLFDICARNEYLSGCLSSK